jgi:hypothetical protein
MSNLHRGPSKDASYQISVHLGKQFHWRRFFLKSTNQKQELSVAAMFVNFACAYCVVFLLCFLLLLLAHLAKGNVSFCHHLASVVR